LRRCDDSLQFITFLKGVNVLSAFSKGILSYPWTIAEAGIEQTIQYIKNELNIDSLYVSVNYHSGRLFQPLSRKKVNMRHDSTLSFPHDDANYPKEISLIEDSDNSIQQSIRKSCEKNGISYNAWVVGLHNSSIGRAHPDYCVTNVFGDIYDFALCPNHPKSRTYLNGLIHNVCKKLDPASLILENPNFLGFVHGHHHEKVLCSLGSICEYLLSLCFCSHCKQTAVKSGIDVDRLQKNVIQRINYLTEFERGHVEGDFSQTEMASLLLEDYELYQYTHMRIDIVTSLMEELVNTVRRHGKKLYVMPSFISSRSWIEGTSLTRLASIVDGFFILSYFSQPERVKADIEWLKLLTGDAPYIVCFQGGAPTTMSQQGLQSCVHTALNLKPEAITYYNMSLLTKTRLEWIGSINKSLS
jgi:hypothetical protein